MSTPLKAEVILHPKSLSSGYDYECSMNLHSIHSNPLSETGVILLFINRHLWFRWFLNGFLLFLISIYLVHTKPICEFYFGWSMNVDGEAKFNCKGKTRIYVFISHMDY